MYLVFVNVSKITGATSAAGTAYHSGAAELIDGFGMIHLLFAMFCFRTIVCPFSFSLCIICIPRYTASYWYIYIYIYI